jgi:hypothetical protein
MHLIELEDVPTCIVKILYELKVLTAFTTRNSSIPLSISSTRSNQWSLYRAKTTVIAIMHSC